MHKAIIKLHGLRAFITGSAAAIVIGGAGLWWVRTRWGDQLLWPVLLTIFVVLILAILGCVLTLVILVRHSGEFEFSENQTLREVYANKDFTSVKWRMPALMRLLSWRFGGSKTEENTANCLLINWQSSSGGIWEEKLCFKQRGYWKSPARIIHIGDTLGLWKIQLEFHFGAEEYYVLPSRCETKKVGWPRNLTTGEDSSNNGKPEGDRIDYRSYQNGDSARYLAWKLMARRGPGAPLLVRSPETVGSPSVGYFFLPGKEDEAAAQLMVNLLEDQSGPEWLFSLPGQVKPFAGRNELHTAKRAIAASACATRKLGVNSQSINQFTQWINSRGVGLVVVVTGTLPKYPYDNYLNEAAVYYRHTLIAIPRGMLGNAKPRKDQQFVTVVPYLSGKST